MIDVLSLGEEALAIYELGKSKEQERIRLTLLRVQNQYATTSLEHEILELALTLIKGETE